MIAGPQHGPWRGQPCCAVAALLVPVQYSSVLHCNGVSCNAMHKCHAVAVKLASVQSSSVLHCNGVSTAVHQTVQKSAVVIHKVLIVWCSAEHIVQYSTAKHICERVWLLHLHNAPPCPGTLLLQCSCLVIVQSCAFASPGLLPLLECTVQCIICLLIILKWTVQCMEMHCICAGIRPVVDYLLPIALAHTS